MKIFIILLTFVIAQNKPEVAKAYQFKLVNGGSEQCLTVAGAKHPYFFSLASCSTSPLQKFSLVPINSNGQVKIIAASGREVTGGIGSYQKPVVLTNSHNGQILFSASGQCWKNKLLNGKFETVGCTRQESPAEFQIKQ